MGNEATLKGIVLRVAREKTFPEEEKLSYHQMSQKEIYGLQKTATHNICVLTKIFFETSEKKQEKLSVAEG